MCRDTHTCICVPVRMYSHISFKGRTHAQIQNKYKILMLALKQNLALFRMVHLVFLKAGAHTYTGNAGWMHAQFGWIFTCMFLYICIILDLQQKQGDHWKEYVILVYKQNGHYGFSSYLYLTSWRAWGHIRTSKHICMPCIRSSHSRYILRIYCWEYLLSGNIGKNLNWEAPELF
jgi:hypothetical protein